MPDNKISFDVKLGAKDIFNFQTQLLLRRSKIIFLIFGVSYLFLISVLLYSYFSVGQLYIITTIIVVTLPIFLHLLRWRVAKKTLDENQALSETQHYIFETGKVAIKGQSFETEFQMKILKRISITKKHILLWHTNTTANIVPRRCLTDEQFEQLKEITAPYKRVKK